MRSRYPYWFEISALWASLSAALFFLSASPVWGAGPASPDIPVSPDSPGRGRVVLASDRFLFWPTGEVVPVLRRFDPPDLPWLPGHRGIDLALEVGSPVFAPTDGTVVYASNLAGRGVVSIEDASGLRYTFEPVQAVVEVGQEVERAELIAFLSDPHRPDRSALHFGVKAGRHQYLDPLKLLGGRIRLYPLRHAGGPAGRQYLGAR